MPQGGWSMRWGLTLVFALTLCMPLAAGAADDVGRVKVAKGSVVIERGGARLPATVGLRLQQGDVIATGRDGSAGVTFNDDTPLSLGACRVPALDRRASRSTT